MTVSNTMRKTELTTAGVGILRVKLGHFFGQAGPGVVGTDAGVLGGLGTAGGAAEAVQVVGSVAVTVP